MITKIYGFIKNHFQEIILVLFLSLIAGLFFYKLSKSIDPIIYKDNALNTWFEADIRRVYLNMIDKDSNHYRTSVHPLFSIFTNPIVTLLIKGFNLWPVAAVRLFNTFLSMVWTSLLYLLFRIMDKKLLDRILLTILGVISSTAIFWMTVSETYLLGSISILLVLILAISAEKKHVDQIWYFLTSLFTLSFTITNWMAGLITTFVNNKLKNSLQISLKVFATTTIIWGIQKIIFPSSQFFSKIIGEKSFFNSLQLDNILDVLKRFFISSMVMPSIGLEENIRSFNLLRMTVQNSNLIPENIFGVMAVFLWMFLLFYGLWNMFKQNKNKKFILIVLLLLGGQLGLHIFYGEETFLYSLHFFPLLLVASSYSLNSKYRNIILVSISFLIIFSGINNIQQFSVAKIFF